MRACRGGATPARAACVDTYDGVASTGAVHEQDDMWMLVPGSLYTLEHMQPMSGCWCVDRDVDMVCVAGGVMRCLHVCVLYASG